MAKTKIEKTGGDERAVERASMVDELFDLEAWRLEIAAPKLKRIEEIKKALVADVNTRFNDRGIARKLEGNVGVAEISPAATKRTVKDAKKAHKLLGDAVFYGGVTVPLKLLDDYLTPEERKQVIDEEDGARSVKVSARTNA